MEENNNDIIVNENKEEVNGTKSKNKYILLICGIVCIVLLVLLIVFSGKNPDNTTNIDNSNSELVDINTEDSNTNNSNEIDNGNNEEIIEQNSEPYTVKDIDGNEYNVKYKFNEDGQVIDFEGNIVEDTSNLLNNEGYIIQNNGILGKDNIFVKDDISNYNLEELEKNEDGCYILPDGRILVYKSAEDYSIINYSYKDAIDNIDKEEKSITEESGYVDTGLVFENNDIKVILESFNRGVDTQYKVKNKQNTGNITFRVYSKNNRNDFTINLVNLVVNGQRLDNNVFVESTEVDSAITQTWFISPDSTNTEEIYSVTCEILVNFWNPDLISTTNTIDVTNMITEVN